MGVGVGRGGGVRVGGGGGGVRVLKNDLSVNGGAIQRIPN